MLLGGGAAALLGSSRWQPLSCRDASVAVFPPAGASRERSFELRAQLSFLQIWLPRCPRGTE